MVSIFAHYSPACVDFSAVPDARRVQQALKHFYNANADALAQPLASIDDFGLRIGRTPTTNVLLMHVVHTPTQLSVVVPTSDDLQAINPVEWMLANVDWWLVEYTPDMIEAFERHAVKVSEVEREWYRVNATTHDNTVVLQKRLFETDYWQTVLTMQTRVTHISQEMLDPNHPSRSSKQGALQGRELMLREQFFCEDNFSVIGHRPLLQLVTSLFLDEDFSFWYNRVEDHGDHITLTLQGDQATHSKQLGEACYGVTLVLTVEKVDPHSVLSILNRTRDVVGDPLEMKDSAQISDSDRHGSLHNRAGLNE